MTTGNISKELSAKISKTAKITGKVLPKSISSISSILIPSILLSKTITKKAPLKTNLEKTETVSKIIFPSNSPETI